MIVGRAGLYHRGSPDNHRAVVAPPLWRLSEMPWDIPDAHPGGMFAVETAAGAARARTSPSQLVMPLFSNAGFVPYLRNLLCSLQRLNVDYWFVIAL